jgi:hypothetical protein
MPAPATLNDSVPVDPEAELSLDNVLTNIRLRGEAGYKLKDYTFSPGFDTVELEFERCGAGGAAKAGKP